MKKCFLSLTGLLLIIFMLVPGANLNAQDSNANNNQSREAVHPDLRVDSVISRITAYAQDSSGTFSLPVEKGKAYLITDLDGNGVYGNDFNVPMQSASTYSVFTQHFGEYVSNDSSRFTVFMEQDATGTINGCHFSYLGYNIPSNVTDAYTPDANFDRKISMSFKAAKTGTITIRATNYYSIYAKRVFAIEKYDGESPIISQDGDMFLSNYDNPLNIVDIKSRITATDNVDGDITSKIVFETNYTEQARPMPGNYFLKATVSDNYGNVTTVTYTIMVIDTKAPIFSGNLNYTIELGNDNPLTLQQIKENLTATDNVDVDIPSDNWTVADGFTANKDKVGTFNITFSATDSSGNRGACTVIITNKDVRSPEWDGESSYEIEVGTSLTSEQILANVFCVDNYDGRIDKSRWVIQDGFNSNFNTVGNSQISLSYTDSNGNDSSYVVNIVVKDTTKPTISGDSKISTPIKLTNEQILALFTYADNYTARENLIISIKSSNFVDKIGSYEYVISCVDENGNENTFTLTYDYIDNEAPVIYASGTVRVPAGTTLTHEQLCAILESLELVKAQSYKSINFESDYFNNLSKDGDYEVKAKITMLDDSVVEKTVKFNVFSAFEKAPEGEYFGLWKRICKFFEIVFNTDKNYKTPGFWGFWTGFSTRWGQAWDILVKNKPYITRK